MTGFVWFSERVSAIVRSPASLDDRLRDLGTLIADAKADNAEGYGPCQDDIRIAVSAWNGLYNEWIAARLPSTVGRAA